MHAAEIRSQKLFSSVLYTPARRPGPDILLALFSSLAASIRIFVGAMADRPWGTERLLRSGGRPPFGADAVADAAGAPSFLCASWNGIWWKVVGTSLVNSIARKLSSVRFSLFEAPLRVESRRDTAGFLLVNYFAILGEWHWSHHDRYLPYSHGGWRNRSNPICLANYL